MAGISMRACAALGDPLPMWRFVCELPTITTVEGLRISPPEKARIQKVSIPFNTINDDQAQFSNGVIFFPTNQTIEQITMTVLESGQNDPFKVLNYFEEWKRSIIDENGGMGLPINYWHTLTVRPLTYTGKVAIDFQLKDAWPKQVAPLEYDSETSAVTLLAITFNLADIVRKKPS